MHYDTGGGSVSGVPELGDKIFKGRGEKPIISIADPMVASAGLWLSAAADKMYITPSGGAGSVGVWSMHEDWSQLLANEGIKLTAISAGKFKTEGAWWSPLPAEAAAEMQRGVDHYHDMFIDALARYTPTTTAKVRQNFGQGRLLRPQDAVAAGMVDGIASFDHMLKSMNVDPAKVFTHAQIDRDREHCELLQSLWTEPAGNVQIKKSNELQEARRRLREQPKDGGGRSIEFARRRLKLRELQPV